MDAAVAAAQVAAKKKKREKFVSALILSLLTER